MNDPFGLTEFEQAQADALQGALDRRRLTGGVGGSGVRLPAELVVFVRKLRAAGETYAGIALELERREIPNAAGRVKWAHAMVSRVDRSPTGTLQGAALAADRDSAARSLGIIVQQLAPGERRDLLEAALAALQAWRHDERT